jgi:primosomal protein N'
MGTYYRILPEKPVPTGFLYYEHSAVNQSGQGLSPLQLVQVPLRNKVINGIILGEDGQLPIDPQLIKPISTVENFSLSQSQYQFNQLFAHNFFASQSTVLTAQLNFFRFLNLSDKKKLNETHEIEDITFKTPNSSGKNSPSFYLEDDIMMRIIYLIRSKKCDKNLVLAPEVKIAEKLYTGILEALQGPDSSESVDIHLYTGTKNRKTQSTVRSLLDIQPSTSQQIIISTRGGIFLPFASLDQIIVTEESSPFYIQEQNQLYYDTRTAAFLLSSCYSADISFVSSVPSIRLLEMYPEEVLDNWVNNQSRNDKNALRLQINKREQKHSEFELFSDYVQELIKPDEEELISFE